MKLQYRLLFVVFLLTAMLVSMGAGEANLLKNTAFDMGGDDAPLNWNTHGSADYDYRIDPEGAVVQAALDQQGHGRLVQNVEVAGEKIYGIRFDARVLDFTGTTGAYAEIEGVEGTDSDKAITGEWETIEIYGMTAPNQTTLSVSFSFGDDANGDTGTAEFRNLQVFRLTGDRPAGSKYVWFYNRDTYLASNTDTENDAQKAPNEGITPYLVIACAYAVLVIVLINYGAMTPEVLDPKKKYNKSIWVYILGGTAISMFIALKSPGFETDIAEFVNWAVKLNEHGITNFYTNVNADYPPGYMYVLYFIGQLAKLFGFTAGSAGFAFLIKLPAIICNAATAYFIYRIARDYVGGKAASLLAALISINPMYIYDSAYWGQIDSILALFMVASFWAFYKERKVLSAMLYMAGVLIKPQMLIVAPVFLCAFLKGVFSKEWKKELKTFLLAVLAGGVVAFVIALPFAINMKPTWLLEKYLSAATKYPYASVNAYNIYAMLGANWLNYTEYGIAGINYLTIGNIAIAIISILGALHIFISKDRKAIFSGALFTVWGIFCFSHSMHERYLFPVLLLSIVCFAVYRDKRYLYLLGVGTIGLMANCAAALNDMQLMGLKPVIIIISTINLLGFVFCTYIVWTSKTRDIVLAIEGPTEDEEQPIKPGSPRVVHTGLPRFIRISNRQGERMVPLDYMNMLIITVVYGLVAMINLGSTQVPESYWRTRNDNESVVIEFKQQERLSTAYYYPGVGKGDITFDLEPEGEGFTSNSYTFEMKENQMYKWQTQQIVGDAKRITLTGRNAGVFINELAFFDSNGDMIEIESATEVPSDFEITGSAAALFDEQNLVDTEPNYMTEMYFDEIYHARTAFEHLNGISPYENSHPPLGKVFIMLGIWIFGMNPFGWRIVGTIFGIAMLPLMYVFAKRIFKDTRFATLATLLFALDGMHFAQTRIATIDVYGVFFIMAMCYYMYQYWQMNFFVDNLRKTFVPLGLSGIMFGFGIASKWIGFYAGAGLAVALFTTFGFRYGEYRKAKKALADGTETDIAFLKKMKDTYWQKVLLTCLFCVGFFIIIPAIIYLLSYLPYILCAEDPYDLKRVWGVQSYMFNYHSKLIADHPFQSPWWQWPIIARPIFYFSGKYLPEGMMSSIAAFGNPAVWWGGLICTIICMVMLVFRDRRLDKYNAGYILICLGAALLPWVFITRATFIYHYFASVPFIILLTVICAQRFVNKKGKMRLPFHILIGASFVLFVLFYPVWSGWPIGLDFALTYIRWLPSWWFFPQS